MLGGTGVDHPWKLLGFNFNKASLKDQNLHSKVPIHFSSRIFFFIIINIFLFFSAICDFFLRSVIFFWELLSQDFEALLLPAGFWHM